MGIAEAQNLSPASPPIPLPRQLGGCFFVSPSLFPSLRLQVVYLLLPILIPTFLVVVLTKLSLETSRSRKRIKLLEKDKSTAAALVHMFKEFEREVEEVVNEMMDVEHSEPANSPEPSEPSITSPPPESDPLEELTNGGDIPYNLQASASDTMTKQPMITTEQKQMIAALNSLPQLKKHMAYFPDIINAHGPII